MDWEIRTTSTGTSISVTRSTIRGLPLNATVHYDQNYDNAYWDGERMVFGDGDGGYSTASPSRLT